jgi:glycosyltransferase involved in cell wall biosynthesis
MARGLPVVTTPLPAAADLVTRYDCGFVIPFADPGAAADAILKLAADPSDPSVPSDLSLGAGMGRRGHLAARRYLGWPADARGFVAQLETWAAHAPAPR